MLVLTRMVVVVVRMDEDHNVKQRVISFHSVYIGELAVHPGLIFSEKR